MRKVWNFDATVGKDMLWGDWRNSLGLDDDGRVMLGRCVEKLRDSLEAYGRGEDQFGLIHADLRLANLLIEGDRITAIDFDDCGFGWFMYDFAAAISFIETSPQIPALQKAWLAGYRKIGVLSDADVRILPTMIMLRRILLTAWVASHSRQNQWQ